jgi:uncharacterized DUF497 family protein
MDISYDPIKNYRNIQGRNLSFDQVLDFDFENAFYELDKRIDYGEVRMRSIGLLENRLHVLVFTETVDGIRVISFRKANSREEKIYEQKT